MLFVEDLSEDNSPLSTSEESDINVTYAADGSPRCKDNIAYHIEVICSCFVLDIHDC